MNKREKLAFAVLGIFALSGGSYALAAYQDNFVSSDQIIYACVTGINGNITKVSNFAHTCPRGTTPISWNMVGPKGDQGAQGAQGLAGTPGQKGEQGLTGSGQVSYEAVSPDGKSTFEMIPGLYGNGPLVKINGAYWSLGEGYTLIGSRNHNFVTSSRKYYASSNCTGDGFMAQDGTSVNLFPVDSVVVSLGGRIFKAKSTDITDFESSSDYAGNGCLARNDQELIQSLTTFATNAASVISENSKLPLEQGASNRSYYTDFVQCLVMRSVMINRKYQVTSLQVPDCSTQADDVFMKLINVTNYSQIGIQEFDFSNLFTLPSPGRKLYSLTPIEQPMSSLNGYSVTIH